MMNKKRILLNIVLLSILFLAIKEVSAVQLNITFINGTTYPSFQIGNFSRNYTITINVSNVGISNATQPLNVTLFMPRGIQNSTAADCGLDFRIINDTTSSCTLNITRMGAGVMDVVPSNATIIAINVTTSVSAFTNYTSMIFTAKAYCGNCTGTANVTQTVSLSGNPYYKNPRPYVRDYSSFENATFIFDSWSQIRPYYEVWAPMMTFNTTSNKTQLANLSFADIIYADLPFIQGPNYMEMWGYRLNFTINFNNTGGLGNTTFRVYTPIVDPTYQILFPLLSMNVSAPGLQATRSFIMAVPSASSFSVWYNGTEYTSQSLNANFSINVAYNTGYGQGADSNPEKYLLLNVSSPSTRGNVSLSVMFTLFSNETAARTVSPLYVQSQVGSGFMGGDAPPVIGGNVSLNYSLYAVNLLPNYTLDDLRLKFLSPTSVTIVNTSATYNLTDNLNVSWRNSKITTRSSWESIMNIITSNISFSLVDNLAGSPNIGRNITLNFTYFEINLTNNTFNNWLPNSSLSNITVNMSGILRFPTLNKTVSIPCTSGAHNLYNLSVSISQQGALNLTDDIGSCFNATVTDVILRIDNTVMTNASNFTVGSLVVNSIGQGTHTVSVSWKSPAAASSSTSSTSSATSSGGTTSSAAAPTEKEHTIVITEFKPNVPVTIAQDYPELPLKELVITTNDKASSVKITTKNLEALPKDTSAPEGVFINSYFSVEKSNLDNAKIKSVDLKFQVTKAWLTENIVDKNDIILQHFTEGSWKKLSTKLISETADYGLYEATTDGLSTFAITSNKAAPSVPETTGEVTKDTEKTQPPATIKKSPSSSTIIIITLLAIIAIMLIVYFIRVGKKQHKNYL
ncbi:MAG TPA: PGF-pre-PGF domain-containing protein [Candidatus Nanoarchaeia archaeon]|nr:PGF-pre-PGF domain-containing protein [Candidatus Nanoarchaeia archaeon]